MGHSSISSLHKVILNSFWLLISELKNITASAYFDSFFSPFPSHCLPYSPSFLACFAVPGAPPRKLEVEAMNSTAIRVTWKPPLQVKQHGQIRGYQVIFSRLENGEPRGQPNIVDIALPEAQVIDAVSVLLSLLQGLNWDCPMLIFHKCHSPVSLISLHCLSSNFISPHTN